MSKIQKKYQAYVSTLQKRMDVDAAIAVLSWDKETYLPEKGARFRSQQVATLSGISHEIFTDKNFGKTLAELREKSDKLDKQQANNIQLSWKEYQRSTKLSNALG